MNDTQKIDDDLLAQRVADARDLLLSEIADMGYGAPTSALMEAIDTLICARIEQAMLEVRKEPHQ